MLKLNVYQIFVLQTTRWQFLNDERLKFFDLIENFGFSRHILTNFELQTIFHQSLNQIKTSLSKLNEKGNVFSVTTFGATERSKI